MNKKFILIYICSRGRYELFPYLEKMHPNLAKRTGKAQISTEAMNIIPESGPVVVLTSNWFHKNPDGPGADGEPEEKMTGIKMAKLIKQKNPQAKVFLYSEILEADPAIDGYFSRKFVKDGFPSDELAYFLKGMNAIV